MDSTTRQLLNELDAPQQALGPHPPRQRHRFTLLIIIVLIGIAIGFGELFLTDTIHLGTACKDLNEKQCSINPKCYPNAVSGCANGIPKPGEYCAITMEFSDCRDIPKADLEKITKAKKDCRHAGGTWTTQRTCECTPGGMWDGKGKCKK